MNWYHWCSIICAAICFGALFGHLRKLILAGSPKDFSRPSGDTNEAVRYAMTTAMSPQKKESAYLYLPTYTTGILYHLGTFLAFALFIILLLGFHPQGFLSYLFFGFLCLTALCGIGILLKRIFKSELRELSNPDDFFSNILVTLFQIATAFLVLNANVEMWYYLIISLMFLYIPIGKLKHVIYFFAARFHLGFFYGWRGVWPPK